MNWGLDLAAHQAKAGRQSISSHSHRQSRWWYCFICSAQDAQCSLPSAHPGPTLMTKSRPAVCPRDVMRAQRSESSAARRMHTQGLGLSMSLGGGGGKGWEEREREGRGVPQGRGHYAGCV